jgi:ElaB/YqjD/DUF883 family membrane-anchored ribosome-binding protein
MASSEQLEREAEATRARIEETLAELRTRISPGQMIDEAIDYARERNGAEIVRNFGRQVTDNPVPVALLGAGLAWLMFAQRQSHNGSAAQTKGDGSVETTEPASLDQWADRTVAMASKFEKTSPRASRKAESATDKASEPASTAYERATEAGSSAYGKAASAASRAYDKAQDFAGSAYERASDAAERSMSSAMESSRGLTKFMQEEPMVVAGIGIALGAIIGALLPATEIENRAMGEASERLKQDAREAASEQWERGKDIAEEGWDEAKEAARRTWEDAKAEAQKGWDDTKHNAGVADGHAGDVTGAQAPLVPSKDETKSKRSAATTSHEGRTAS